MSNIDVRNVKEVTGIRFADVDDDWYGATKISRYHAPSRHPSTERVRIEQDDLEEDQYVIVNSAEHAENLILALRKSIELGWLK